MMKYILLLFFFSFFASNIAAQEEGPVHKMFDQAVPERPNKEFQFLAYFYNQAVTGNIYPENDLFKGQIIGRLFGQNTTKTSDSIRTFYIEQRLLPFFIYSPRLFNGKATLRASFEIDWTWGDVNYGVGGNFGSAFSADQVNLQTQNVELELLPWKGWAINIGLQRLFDTPYNPYRTYFDKMNRSGYRLAYWGSDAVGINVRRDYDHGSWRLGFYQLYENLVNKDDDVTLTEYTIHKHVNRLWNLGGSVYWLRDRANGAGGVSILGQGLNSALADYNGVYRFPLGGDPYRADIFWIGSFFSRNEDMMWDNWSVTGFVNANVGTVRQLKAGAWTKTVDVAGVAANLRLNYRYGQTEQDAITLDGLFSSGDDGIDDGTYSGVLTGNNWGSPGGIFISSGSYLLFPHGNVVNRLVAAVNDIANRGNGLTGGTLNVSKAFIPHRWYGKVGMASAFSNVEASGNGGFNIGTEFNGMTGWQLGPFMNIEAHGAWMSLGDYYDSPATNGGVSERPANPWTAFLVFKWLMF